MWEEELIEYEEFYHVPPRNETLAGRPEIKNLLHELLHGYRNYIISEQYDTAIEIMQSYTDLKLYSQGEFWQDKGEKIKAIQDKALEAIISLRNVSEDIVFRSDTISKINKLLVGREDIFAREELDAGSSRIVNPDLRPLTEAVMKEHLLGKITADTYVQRSNSTVRFIVFDIDISKHILLKVDRKSDEFMAYMQKALNKSQDIKKLLEHMSLPCYIEYSGNRGYHLWLFLLEWIPTRYANLLCEIVDREIAADSDISIEFFPNKTRIKNGKYGQAIKIPYGIHGKTGERSYFLDEAGAPILDINRALDSFARVSLADIKKVIASHAGNSENIHKSEVDTDISAFGDLDDAASEVLTKCNLMRYLCLKSVKTNYLNHFERLTILYVFGHLGDTGKEFVHTVMSFTLNYKHHVTENFIRKMPEKPISCVKLRDQYKQQTAEFGCSCSFKRNRNCYPSPVLHAISLSDDLQSDVTLPTSKTLSKDNETKVKAEINIYSKAQEIAVKILEFKKQKRSIDKNIARLEKELDDIFSLHKIDSLEIDMGVMKRRTNADGSTEWFIEI